MGFLDIFEKNLSLKYIERIVGNSTSVLLVSLIAFGLQIK